MKEIKERKGKFNFSLVYTQERRKKSFGKCKDKKKNKIKISKKSSLNRCKKKKERITKQAGSASAGMWEKSYSIN